jgi:PAS domain S-box-containing protein
MVTDADVEAALRQERIRLHLKVLPTSMVASATIGLVLAAVLWNAHPAVPLAGWLAALGLALATRGAVGWAQHRDAQGVPNAGAWLQRHRVALLLHGVVWASVTLLAAAEMPAGVLELMVFAMAAITAGAFISIAFDVIAALCFAAPPVISMALALALHPGVRSMALWLMALVFIGVTAAGARRSQRAVGEGVRLRLAAQRRADEARDSAERADRAFRQLADQHQLLTQLLQTTRQGFWFIDNEARTTNLNPAMATLLGQPREAVLGRGATEFMAPEDLPAVQQQLHARSLGQAGRYEATLLRPDGTRVHCLCQASPIRNAAGAQVGSVGIWTDISESRRTEAVLRSYELVVNSITDLVSVVDTDERYILVNDAWCRHTGVARKDAIGRSSTVAAPSTVHPERRRALRACVETGAVQVARGPSVTPGRTDLLLETTYFPHRADDGRVVAVALLTRDITDQERQRLALQAREAEQRAFVEAFPGYIGRLDEALHFTYANQRLAALLQRPAAAVVGHTADELFGPASVVSDRSWARRALAGEPVLFEFHHPHPDGGGPVDLQVTLTRGTDPQTGAAALYAFAIDISGRKRAEAALIAARDEAERANRAKSQFLSQMSHELRTPLNAILGFGQLLQSDARQALAGHQQPWVREILRGAEHLLELINEILDLGRIETGELALELAIVDLQGLARECLDLVQALAAQRGVHVRPLPPTLAGATAYADRRRLKQVLLNLLGNAIKYNQPGGEVALHVSHEGPLVWLAVRDDGPGLSAEQQSRLFQPFERLDAARSGVEGTGIGLALCKRLVQAMGGSIGVDSQPGQGCTFWLRLPPLAPAPALPAPPAGEPVPADTPAHAAALRTVLYVEDNNVNVLLMEAMLARLPGLRLLSALHPVEGLRLARAEKPALVLLDIQLPDMSGFEVLARLRADPGMRDVPVVAVSANALQRDIDAALAAGFNAYITKPVVLEELLATVQQALGGPGSGR